MSKPLTYNDVRKALEQKTFAPAYLIYGEESALIDELTRELVGAYLKQPEREINYFIRYASETPLEALVPLWSGASLFAERKVIEYRDFQALKSKKLDPLVKYLQQPNPDVCLLLQVRDTSVPRFASKLQGLVTLVEVNTLDLRALERIVAREARQKGKTMDPEAIRTFLFYVGNHLQDVQMELVQLFNYYHEQSTISESDVENFVRQRPTKTIFDFTRALGEKNRKMVVNYLHQLLERGESPFAILFFVQRFFLLMWKIKGYALDASYTESDIQKALGLYSRHYQQYKHQAARWRMREIQQALQYLKETDAQMKSSQAPPELLLDILIGRLINLT